MTKASAANGGTYRSFGAGILICLLCLLWLLPACSIFDLKDPELPIVGAVTEDPLNIGSILRVADESAVDMNYRDYFTDNVEFEDYLMRRIIGKDKMTAMLERLRTQTSLVEWEVEKADKRIADGAQYVENVPYTVYSGGKAICAGMADFHIVMGLEYMISYWKDSPRGGQTPFFEP